MVKAHLHNSHIQPAQAQIDWPCLERAGRIFLDAASRARLEKAMAEYQSEPDTTSNIVKSVKSDFADLTVCLTNARCALAELLEKKNFLSLQLLHGLSEVPREETASAAQQLKDMEFYLLFWEVQALTSHLRLPSTRGRPTHKNARKFLAEAYSVFRSAGGKGRESKTAIAYFNAVCAVAGVPLHSIDALKFKLKTLRS